MPRSSDTKNSADPQQNNISRADRNELRKRIALMVLLLVVVLIILALFSYCSSSWIDEDAQTGSLQGLTREQVIEELNKKSAEGMMNITMASEIVFASNESEGAARIQNLPSNRFDQKVTITLDKTGDILYSSGAIMPGQYIEFISLESNLPPGTHDATATFDAYKSGTRAKEGTAALRIKITMAS